MQTSILRIETRSTPPIEIQKAKLRLRSQLVQLRFPGVTGGIIWNRPVAVVVRGLDGQEEIVAIPDVTRTVVLTLAGVSFASMLVLLLLRRKNTES